MAYHIGKSFPARGEHEELVVDDDIVPFTFKIMLIIDIDDERGENHRHGRTRIRIFQPTISMNM
jgi:hypothetical protein